MTARGPTRTNPPYWPGGIPSHIKCHPEPIPAEAWAEEVKGWLLFLDVSTAVILPVLMNGTMDI